MIEIDARGWRVRDDPPVRFRKPSGMRPLPLPLPRRGGSVSKLRDFLNVPDNVSFSLVVAWVTSALRPDGPFPLLILLGEQGSAKTTTALVLKRLIDPSAAPVRGEPREIRDLMIHARNTTVMAFDNLSYVPPWMSDALCRLATGGGFAARELYSNDDETIFEARRPAILNGIEDFVTRADLLERSLLVRHPPIPEAARRAEAAFWAAFDAAHPELLGALLDRVSAGLREFPLVTLPALPRMADFALFAVACERGAGERPQFLAAYTENQAGAHVQALDACPGPAALDRLMAERGDEWRGTPAALLDELTRCTSNPPPKDWPKKPNVLTGRLRRLAPNLRRVLGLDVDCDNRTTDRSRTREVIVSRLPGAASSESSGASADEPFKGESGAGGGRSAVGARPEADGPAQLLSSRKEEASDGADVTDDPPRSSGPGIRTTTSRTTGSDRCGRFQCPSQRGSCSTYLVNTTRSSRQTCW